MIRSILPVEFTGRKIEMSKVQLEILEYKGTPEGNYYIVHDYAISEDEQGNVIKRFVAEKTVFYTSEKINALNTYLEANNDYTGLSKMDRDWLKIKQGLLLDTQTNLWENNTTIYGLQPNDWEVC